MESVRSLVEKRNELMAKAEAIRAEANDMWPKIKDAFLRELTELGVYKRKWKYCEDLNAGTFLPGMLVINDDMAGKIISLTRDYGVRGSWAVAGERVFMCVAGESVQIRFDRLAKPAKFISDNDIRVDFSYIDKQIADLNRRKAMFGGDEE